MSVTAHKFGGPTGIVLAGKAFEDRGGRVDGGQGFRVALQMAQRHRTIALDGRGIDVFGSAVVLLDRECAIEC